MGLNSYMRMVFSRRTVCDNICMLVFRSDVSPPTSKFAEICVVKLNKLGGPSVTEDCL